MCFLLNIDMYVYFMIPSYATTLDIGTAFPLLGVIVLMVATIAVLVFIERLQKEAWFSMRYAGCCKCGRSACLTRLATLPSSEFRV